MISPRSLCIALCLQALLAGAAAAQEAYVTAGAGAAHWRLDCGPDGCKRSTSTWRAGAGVRLHQAVAIEGFYIDFGRARSSDFDLDGRLGATAIGAQALIGWQGSEFAFNGKIGLARLSHRFDANPTSSYASSRATKSEPIGGLMAGWRVAPRLSVRLDVDIVTVALNGDAIYYSRGSDVVTALVGVALTF